MRITVLERAVEENKWTDKEGNERVTNRQWCQLEVDGLVQSFQVNVDEPLPAGPAELSPNSFSVVNGRLQLTRPVLVPLKRSPVSPRPAPSAS